MNQGEILEALEQFGAIVTDSHIVYTSGKHGNAYVNKDAIYPHTKVVSRICQLIAGHFSTYGVEVVAAPAIGGVILSQWVSHHLQGTGSQTLALYAEKSDTGTFEFRRGYDKFLCGKKVLIVEDVLTTGGSVKAVVQAVRQHAGNLVGVGAICNRGSVTADSIDNPPELFALLNISLDAWDEEYCPLCKQGVPINIEVGKGREYVNRKKIKD